MDLFDILLDQRLWAVACLVTLWQFKGEVRKGFANMVAAQTAQGARVDKLEVRVDKLEQP